MNNSLQSAQSIASVYLTNFANSENFWQEFEVAFGNNYDQNVALNIQKNLANKIFTLPEIVIIDRQILGTADGVFAAGNNTIYLSNYFVNNNDSQRVVATLIEEFGHWIDAQINTQDSAGDEGEIFSALVMGAALNPTKLARLKAENDHAVIQINRQQLNIEQANITGTSGNDSLSGTDLADTINALAGDDHIYGAAGNDTLNGGAGDDDIYGDAGNNTLNGGDGNDTLQGKDGNDTLNGGAGNDTLEAGNGTNTVNGGTGIDNIIVFLESNTNLTANISTGSLTLAGTTFTNVEQLNFASTGSGNNTITGGAYDDYISSGSGNDTINGGDGNDWMDAGNGINTVNGGMGIDSINVNLSSNTTNLSANISAASFTLAGTTFTNVERFGSIYTGSGNDTITGGAYDDSISSGAGNDTVNGGAGDDEINDHGGNNFIDGAAGDDHIYSGAGNDTLNGGAGDDRINDYGGNNFIDGATGNDYIQGGDGNDTLNGGAGNDVIRGDGGSDSINGGAGNDTIYGDNGFAGGYSFSSNDGDDTYIFNTGFGRDTIQQGGFGTDTVKFGAGLTLAKFQINRQGNDLIFTVKGTNDTLTIKDGLDTSRTNVAVDRFQFDNGATTKTINELAIDPDPANLSLVGNIIKIGGDSKIKFTINQDTSDRVTQICAFKVDDVAGTINGVAPTATDYATKAVSKANVIFSSIVNPPAGFDRSELARIVTDFKPNDLIGFYAVQANGTDGKNTPIFLGTTPNSPNFKATDLGNNSIGLNWRSADNRSLNIDIVAAQTTEIPRVSTTTQNSTEGLALDLTKLTLPAAQVNFTVYREGTHNNSVGFYKVLDASGAIKTSTGSILNPQDAGYVQAALQAAVSQTLGAELNLATTNQSSITIDATLDKSLYMPIITVNGTLYEAAAGKNLGQTYTSFLGANPDKANHIRLLGDNTFGFEDLNGGGDLDFNDIIVKAQVG